MRIKSILAAASAFALVAAPTAASAQAPLPAELAPQSETVEGSATRGGVVLPLLVLLAILVAVLGLTGDEDPDSP